MMVGGYQDIEHCIFYVESRRNESHLRLCEFNTEKHRFNFVSIIVNGVQ